jgi:broad specificity phosphatase PhoE
MTAGVKLFVIRHGETDWNAEKRYQGQADIPLNDKGRKQAKRNGLALESALLPEGLTAAKRKATLNALDFVASPLARARETMEIIRAALDLPPETYRTDDNLKELSYGHWEGLLQSDLPSLDPVGVEERSKDPFHWRPRGGESYADLLQRSRTWLATINGPAVVVAHGGTLRTLQGVLTDIAESRIPTLAVPQDKVMRVEGNSISWL